jgi:hypothetical protein
LSPGVAVTRIKDLLASVSILGVDVGALIRRNECSIVPRLEALPSQRFRLILRWRE